MSPELERTLDGMLHSKLANYVSPGLESWMISGQENHGKVRLFVNTRDQDYFIQPHSHRYAFSCLVLEGTVTNMLYLRNPSADLYEVMTYDHIKHELTSDGRRECFYRVSATYELGGWYHMKADDIHSIAFSRDAKVLFFEGKSVFHQNVVLQPVVNGKTVTTFHHEPWMYQED